MQKFFNELLTVTCIFVLVSCGNNSKTVSSDEGDTISTEVLDEEMLSSYDDDDEENQNEEEQTINGLIPGQEYRTRVDGWTIDVTMYNDGTVSSKSSGEGYWSLVSKHDKQVVEIRFNVRGANGTFYIDDNQRLYINSLNSDGYELDAIGYIPKDAKGMEIGKSYKGFFARPFVSARDITITLLEEGEVKAIDEWSEDMNFKGWEKVTIDNVEYVKILLSDGGYAILVDKGLNHYYMSDNESEGWKDECKGKLKEL